MIGIVFEFAGSYVMVQINGNDIRFGKREERHMANIDGLKLDYQGVVREFPDLKDTDNWRQIAINRFKDKIKSLQTEDEKIDYIIKDLKKYGYKPLYKQRAGHRVEKFKEENYA